MDGAKSVDAVVKSIPSSSNLGKLNHPRSSLIPIQRVHAIVDDARNFFRTHGADRLR